MLNLDVTIDESVFAAPRVSSSVDDVNKYAEELMIIGDFLKAGTIRAYMTRESLYSFDTEKDYSYETLQNLFDKTDECSYSSRDVLTIMKHIREFIFCFEKNFDIFSVDVSGNTKTNPKIETVVLSKKRRFELKKSALMIAILLNCCDEFDPGHALILKYKTKRSRMSIETKICHIDSGNPKVNNLPRSPDTFREDIPIFYELSEVMTILKAINIMGRSIDKQAQNDAYSAAFRKVT